MTTSNGPALLRSIAMAALALCGACLRANGQTVDAPQPSAGPSFAGNVLAHMPLASLTATRERPLFSPTRRGPPPAPIVPDQPPLAPPARTAEMPRLTLLGIIRSPESGGSAVVLDETDHTSFSLKLGDNRRGWVVQSIDSGEVVLRKEQRSETLRFPTTPHSGPPGQAIDD